MKQFIIFVFATIGIALLHTPSVQAASNSYAALGDSIAAVGESGETSGCRRSTQAYPHAVAKQTGLTLQHIACSGAKADEGVYGSQSVDSASIAPQLTTAFANGTPQLITLTIGANDTRWTQFIKQCYYIKCGYKVDTARFNAYLLDLKLELNVIMAKISTLSNGTPPQTILTGYYSPFASSTLSCDDTDGITSEEVRWIRTRTQALNTALSKVASKYSYVKYAPVDFKGHELCSTDPWVQGLSDPMVIHPTAAGSNAIARAVMKKYKQPSDDSSPISNREKILNWYNRNKR
jgi:lysophospholipase L1-like esterase